MLPVFDTTICNISGVPDDKRQQAMQMLGDSSKMTYTISNTGNDWTFGVSTSAGSRDINFTLGTEIDTSTLDGRPLKVITVNTIIN